MPCSGLHCAGCAGGMALPVVPALELCGLAWVAAHLAEVAAVSAACGALAVAAVVALMRWGDRRAARHAAGHPLLIARPETIAVPGPERPAIAPAVINLNFYGVPAEDRAAIIRGAIGLPPG